MKLTASALLVGLTGGIASGKSTVAERLAQDGAALIDADIVSRELVQPGESALDEIVVAFGPSALNADGSLDRRRLRQLIFEDSAARSRLEGILHPRVESRMRALATSIPGPYVVLAVPLLAEVGRYDWLDRVVVVDCPVELQRDRLMRRDGVSSDLANAMIAAQADRSKRLAIADDVIRNDGTHEQLLAAADDLHRRLLTLAANHRQRTC